ncbi:polysaccharide chain length determinant protein, PEP-CTERM locus subfamily [Desulfonatronum thiosulfatophilum]|uniref:Polysaccharide chain length determinant protein, PEP-CTERM locus subfamily n=1 Tax=Desulfonatronum thiosulfatophilum TaxID=617002 RepID=A0A1G6EKJ7_9BACT|nr:XrtA system polysaccharide chain length determinant [Desulfonatronum thiosulfatophilum]SDB57927.1 polysaccharide chain length determinant protein, PEP-CTERM locus subfamily [Desulfonatronum thiosulfatophilum]
MSDPKDLDIRKYLAIAYRRRFLIIFATIAVTIGATLYSLALKNMYSSSSTVFIEENVMSSLMQGVAVTPSMDAKIRVLTTAMQSRTMLQQVLRDLNMDLHARTDAELEGLINNARQRMDIRLRARDGLFIISFSHENPREARDFVNTLVRRYIEQNISADRDDTYAAFGFLAEQIEIHRARLEEADAAVLELRIRKGDLLNRDPGQLLEQIAMAEDRLQELSIRRYELLSSASSEAALAFDDQGLPMSGHQGRLNMLQRKLAELQLRYGPSYPEVVRVKAEMQMLEKGLYDEGAVNVDTQTRISSVFDVQLQELRLQEQRLRRMIQYYNELLENIPVAQAEFAEVQHKRSEQQRVLEQLMGRYGQAEISRQMELQDKTTTFRIVDPAILPTNPSSPNRLMIILLGMLGGLGAGVGMSLGLNYLDRSVRHVDTLKELGLPVLAVVPEMLNPANVRKMHFRNLLLYLLAAAFFMLIVGVMLLEFMGSTILYDYVQNIVQRPETESAIGYMKGLYRRIF